jgi:hypothetical protein
MTGREEPVVKKKESLFVTEIICYFEKSLSFSKVSQHQLNNRPRKKLEFKNTL